MLKENNMEQNTLLKIKNIIEDAELVLIGMERRGIFLEHLLKQ